jgi:acetyl-CoA synthetase
VTDTGSVHHFSYEDINAASDTVAATLADRGIGRGDPVALCLPQSPELLVGQLAVLKCGAIVVPLSVLLGRDSLEHALDTSGCDIVVTEDTIAERFDSALSAYSLLTPELDAERYDEAGALGGFAPLVGGESGFAPVDTALDDDAFLMFTSGTSGSPKGVVQGHDYLIGSLPGFQLYFQLLDPEAIETQRIWTPAEWAWAGALFDVVYPTLLGGGTVVSRFRRSKFSPMEALEHVANRRITRAFLPPTALQQIRNETSPETLDLGCLDVVLCGGEPLSQPLKDWAETTLDIVVNEAYGQTEANSILGESSMCYPARDGTTGRPYPGHTVAVETKDGTRERRGAHGELLVRTPDPVVFEKYWNNPGATERAFTEDGWLKTGDAAFIDSDGYAHIEGRIDELIITAGYRVSPFTVETILELHADVANAVVGGVDDDQRGERIKAYVVPVPDWDGNEDALVTRLVDHVSAELGPHKKPREMVVRRDLPTTTNGKVDRGALF